MAISRMQMYRQLRAGGGIMNLAPREKFGLGSKLKKFVRNIIPNEVADIAVKAAPFVAPFNPAIAGAMAALGSFDQTGSISKGVKSGLINYGLGNVARVLGGAGPQFGFKAPGTGTGLGSYFTSPTSGAQLFGQTDAQKLGKTIQADAAQKAAAADLDSYAGIEEYLAKTDPSQLTLSQRADLVAQDLATKTKPGYKDLFSKVIQPDATFSERTQAITDLGGKALKDIYTKPVTIDGKTEYQVDKLAVGATIAGAANYIEARKLAKEAELVDDEDQYTEEMYEADKARYKDYYSQILTPEAFGLKDGGIISLRKMKQSGSVPEEFISYTDDNSGVIYYDPEGNPITKAEAMKAFDEMPPEDQVLTDMEGKPLGEPKTRKRILPMPKPKEMVFEGRMKRLMEAKGILEPESFEYLLQKLKDEMTESGIPSIKLEKKATGGRVGYKDGKDPYDKLESKIISIDPLQDTLDDQLGIGAAMAPGLMKLMSRGAPKFSSAEKTLVIRNLAGRSKGKPEYKELGMSIPEAKAIMDEPTKYLKDATILKEFVKMISGKKDGGRIDYAMGSEVPVRQNQAGINEMDFRETGGFVPPIGVKERADDIPAMLSNNEFVFTADAVRAAGGGSVNKGAQKMYALMKQLENKVV